MSSAFNCDLPGLFPIARILYTFKKWLAFSFKECDEMYNLSVMDRECVCIYVEVLLATFQFRIICRTMYDYLHMSVFMRG